MKGLRLFSVLAAVAVTVLVMSPADAQLLKRVIKTQGGGGSDVVDLISNIPNDRIFNDIVDIIKMK